MSWDSRIVELELPVGRVEAVERDGILRARGIPFARMPRGADRFRPALRREPFATPFDASREGATPQRGVPFEQPTIPEPSIGGDDILHVSITAPAGAAPGSAPVLFWIHGGGFVAGSPASPWYDGEALARRGIVVVRTSYRLGVEGFGVIDGDANRGLGDLLLALEWVRECIAPFGGDPARITIAGQSAGASAVLCLLAAPTARGAFARAVAISPAVLGAASDFLVEFTDAVASRLGVEASAEGFATRDAQTVQDACFAEQAARPPLSMLGPAVDSALLPDGFVSGVAAHGAGVPLLIGATADEFDYGPTLPEGERVTDTLFRRLVPAVSAAHRGPCWTYSFDWPSPVLGGAAHCTDLPFFFDIRGDADAARVLGDAAPAALAARMSGELAAFVHGERPSWPPSTGAAGDVALVFGPDGETREVAGRYDRVRT